MFDTLVPFKSIFGTLFIFLLFIGMFFAFVVSGETMSGSEWFFVPTIIVLALALIKCIQNISEIIKLKDDSASQDKLPIELKTCPEYWVKSRVYTKDENNKNVPIEICKNYRKLNQEDGFHFVGGKNTNFAQNFKVDSSINNPTIQETISNLNSKFVPQSNIDKFVDYEVDKTQYGWDRIPGNNRNFITVGNSEDPDDPRMVTYMPTGSNVLHLDDSNNYIPSFSNTRVLDQHYDHIHYVDYARLHKGHLGQNVQGYQTHSNTMGHGWHTHEQEYRDEDNMFRSSQYSSNWINIAPSDATNNQGDAGVEINLTKLNTGENICELAKNFYWTEAYNACMYNKDWNMEQR